MIGTVETKREIIGQALLDGKNQTEALVMAGYSVNSARGSGKNILKSIDIDTYIAEWKDSNAGGLLERLTKSNQSDEELQKAREDIAQVDNPAIRAKLRMEFAKVTTGRKQDILDRMGIGKVSKSIKLTGKVADVKDRAKLVERIKRLSAELGITDTISQIDGNGTEQNGKQTTIDHTTDTSYNSSIGVIDDSHQTSPFTPGDADSPMVGVSQGLTGLTPQGTSIGSGDGSQSHGQSHPRSTGAE